MATENPVLSTSPRGAAPSMHGFEGMNKHILHRHESIHDDEDRSFLMRPDNPRTDHSPNLSSFKDRKVNPVKKIQKMQMSFIEA